MQRDEIVVRNDTEDGYIGERDQSHIHKQHKQANNCNAKQSAALSMVEYFQI